MNCIFKNTVILCTNSLFYNLLICIIIIMQLKRTRLEMIDTEKRYNNIDQNESDSYNWKLFLILFIILIIIILFITFHRYIYGQIIYIFKRFIIICLCNVILVYIFYL